MTSACTTYMRANRHIHAQHASQADTLSAELCLRGLFAAL
jgi:hypothetical protein